MIVFYLNIILLPTLQDNENLLEELKDKQPISYLEAFKKNKEDIFRVWKETYSQDFATKGIFEKDIQPYEIGKTKYSLADLTTISNNDIQGKYHQFATILRQHNVSGRENAFDKLVNLFLCKIVDETNNPEELKFYWKGIAYDSFFELQDRLQKLYQEGMKRFLEEDVTYIDNEAIDQAFRFFQNDPDATRDTIKKYFRQLKFFTNNDFAFIDVHNEKLFYQNSAVLLKLVQMLQDIRLKTQEEHQFLGDMFEGFLDQGIKQSEGQFFTPIPIVKFILKSLPLEQIITESEEIPKVIDYACGAGHFLNEYAQEIKPIVEGYQKNDIKKYYQNVVGIEKEYRLSKVAKVSAFMYGQDEIKIVYADTLATIPNIKENDYSILVANPPYSVKGFLETLEDSDRKKYQLIETIEPKSYPNNSIETFFIEKAKQLLKPDGVIGIIVPSSILNKSKAKSTSKSTNIYVATREILLKYFDIIAIAEFGSGTFGKTGTNTVTLFLRRKPENPAPADHYFNRVNSWFKGEENKDKIFQDEYLIRKYCHHLEFNFDNYKTFLAGEINDQLLKHDIFKEYQKEFDKWTVITKLKKQRSFKGLTKEEKKEELNKRFMAYVQDIERDKLYYFVLATLNPQKVLIMKSPSKNTEIKEFLGYEWSSAKGNEGIKYLGSFKLDKIEGENEDEGIELLDKEDKRVLSNLANLDNINTPLYDPKNNDNPEKINFLIKQNFLGETVDIPESLSNVVTSAFLVDMLDFSRPDFSKSISLTPKKSIKIKSKWTLSKLGEIAEVKNGGTPDTNNPNYWDNGDICWATLVDTKNKYLYDTARKITEIGLQNSSAQLLPINTVIFSSRATIGEICINKVPTATNQGYKNFICNEEKVNYEYLYYILNYYKDLIDLIIPPGTKYKEISLTDIKNFEIPLPPPVIQEEIVKACQVIDEEFEQAETMIKSKKEKIEKLFNDAFTKADKNYRLDNESIFDVSIGQRVLKNELKTEGKIPVYSANVFEPFGYVEKLLIEDFSKPSVLWGIDGDWMVNYYPADNPFYPTDHCGVIRVKNDEIHPRYLAWILYQEGEAIRFSRHHRASIDRIQGITVKVPSSNLQVQLISEIEKCEAKIKEAQDVINGIAKRKDKVIYEYL